jgi:hypothetical protein
VTEGSQCPNGPAFEAKGLTRALGATMAVTPLNTISRSEDRPSPDRADGLCRTTPASFELAAMF